MKIIIFISLIACCFKMNVAMEPTKSISMPSISQMACDSVASPRKFSLKTMQENEGKSALLDPFIAVRKKNLEALTRIVRIKCIFDANVKEEATGQTLLHYAVFNRDESMIRFLMLEAKANPAIENDAGKSALALAKEIGFKHIETVINECIKEHNASISAS